MRLAGNKLWDKVASGQHSQDGSRAHQEGRETGPDSGGLWSLDHREAREEALYSPANLLTLQGANLLEHSRSRRARGRHVGSKQI